MKNIIIFHLKINIFAAVKYCCILHGRVCVMTGFRATSISYMWEFLSHIYRNGNRNGYIMGRPLGKLAVKIQIVNKEK